MAKDNRTELIQKLIGFGNKHLKAPYDTLTATRVAGGSKYNPSTGGTKQSQLGGCLTNTLTYFISTKLGETNKAASGIVGVDTYVGEYHSEIPNITDIVVYDASSGDILAAVYDTDTSSCLKYTIGHDEGNRNGNGIHAALFPVYMQDDEFKDTFNELVEEAKKGYPDRNLAGKLMGVLNDNVYYRMKDDKCTAHIALAEPSTKTLSFSLIRNASLTTGTYNPESVLFGEFELLTASGSSGAKKTSSVRKTTIELADFVGKYPINPGRELTETEKKMMEENKLEKYYIIPQEAVDVCEAVVKTSSLNNPFRNFTFMGDAGTGKSSLAKAVAAGLGIPSVIYTCSANTEIFDFIGQVMPSTGNETESSNKLIKELEELGGITFENIAKVLKLPNIIDIEFDPAMSYEEMTGTKVVEKAGKFFIDGKEIGDEHEMFRYALNAWQIMMTEEFNKIVDAVKDSGETKFIYTETPFIRAVKYGWVVEVQEPNVIISEGTLVGLNGLLEEGQITLPTGEIIQRHPDCVIIFTTNVSYNGCRAMNQSVIDRSHQVYPIDSPSVEVMAERAMSISGNTDEDVVLEMAQIVRDMAADLVKEGVDDGVCGMRSLTNWATNATFENPYKAFEKCVLSKVSMDSEVREAMRKRIDESSFRIPKRSKTR